MIATIGPLVQEARRQWWRSVALHVAGSAAGGIVVFASLAILGHVLVAEIPASARWAAAGTITLALVPREFGFIRWRLPMIRRSVPKDWWLRLGPNRGALAYGLVLGMGITTIIPFGTFYAAALWAFLVANPLYGSGIGLAYGIARAFPVIAASFALVSHSEWGSPRARVVRLTDGVHARKGAMQVANGLAEAGFAAAAVAAVLLAVQR